MLGVFTSPMEISALGFAFRDPEVWVGDKEVDVVDFRGLGASTTEVRLPSRYN